MRLTAPEGMYCPPGPEDRSSGFPAHPESHSHGRAGDLRRNLRVESLPAKAPRAEKEGGVAGHVGYGPWRALEVNDEFRVGRGADYSIAARLRRVRATAAKWASLLP